MATAKDSFGVQAAKFSMYAPAVAFVLGLFLLSQPGDSTAGAKTMAQVRIAVGGLNAALLLGGLAMGVVALSLVGKFGREGILGRAIVGVTVNGLLVGLMAIALVPAMSAGRVRNRVVGHWRGPQATPARAMDVAFDADGTFTMASAPGVVAPKVAVAGHWYFTRDQLIGVEVDRVDTGDPGAVGKKMGLGKVKTISDAELVLSTDHGDERFARE